MKNVTGGLVAPEGFNTACECVGSIGAYVANFPNALAAALDSIASAKKYCSSHTLHCTYNGSSGTGNWTVTAN